MSVVKHIIAILLVSLGMVGCISSLEKFRAKIEAESGQLNGLAIESDSTASNSKYISFKDSGMVFWNVAVPDSNYYNILFRYNAYGGSKEQILVKNNKLIPIGLSMAETWSSFSQPFYLNKGENKIGIKSSCGHSDFDYLQIEPANVSYGISPKKQTIYQSDLRDLVFKIENYHKTIQQVTIDGEVVSFQEINYPYTENSVWLKIPKNELSNIVVGRHELTVQLGETTVTSELNVFTSVPKHGLTIVAADIEHGTSVLIKLPTGRFMLIDTGKDWVRDSILIPMYKRNGIDTIHTLVLTHYHGDHDSGDKGKKIKQEFQVQDFYDYKSFKTGEVWKTDSVSIKVLNSYVDGKEENKRSLAFTLEYNGFVYNHGGDTYGVNQERMIKDFGDENKAHVFFANHHFHGSLLPEYVHTVNPDVVLLQAQETIYARSAYVEDYKRKSEAYLNKQRSEPIETLVALELGASVISVSDSTNWWYATYKNQDEIKYQELR